MTRFYLTGGRRRASLLGKPEWARFERALLLELDTASGEVQVLAEHESPESAMPAPGTHVFKAATRWQDALWVVTQTEVLAYPENNFAAPRIWSHGLHNDLHHVLPHQAGFHVVSTGLDSLISHDLEGRVQSTQHALGDELSAHFDLERDWRQVPSTKPHQAHPNYYFENAEGRWLTRFEQRDAVCLDDFNRRMVIEIGNPHDGLVVGDQTWFTTTNGMLHAFHPGDERASEVHDLNQYHTGDCPLGWCRGLHIAGEIAYVGFSRVRATRIRKNLSWLKNGFRLPDGMRSPPTRVAAFDLRKRAWIQDWDLEPVGMGAIFSVIPRGAPS